MFVIINEDGQLLTNDNGDFHCDLSEAAQFETIEEAEGILTEILTQYREMFESDAPEEYSWMSIIEMSVISDMDSLGLVHSDKDGNKLKIGDIIESDYGWFAISKITRHGVMGDWGSKQNPEGSSIESYSISDGRIRFIGTKIINNDVVLLWARIRKHWRLSKNED